MTGLVRRIFVQKKEGFDVEAKALLHDLKESLGIEKLEDIKIVNRYDMSGVSDEEYAKSRSTIFSESTVDYVYDEELPIKHNEKVFAIEYLPGQYDQRADSASQCVQILTEQEKPIILSAKVFVLTGDISKSQFDKIKSYCINPVDSREAFLEKPETLEMKIEAPSDVEVLEGFITLKDEDLSKFIADRGLAMTLEDLKFCQNYFNSENRNPTITEIKVIDTYWSDHCRHTTFQTRLQNIEIEKGMYSSPIEEAYKNYLEGRKFVYGDREKDVCLMDIAVLGMKELRKKGKLEDLDVSEEINACSIVVDADVNGKTEKWLVMFKNETHNHPTEIEPFGGAATCLGGAIRDPLSGRSYVYQAMRVTGSGDPRTKIEDTIPGRLPQKKITQGAAHGYSSYGNQIGLATGQVAECYDNDFAAKRMEVGAVIAAAPKENVVREEPKPGDIIILLGGRTGRDGCGGATGSSKEHTEESLETCGAEVQKGNAPTERKIQRLFRNSKVSTMIKRCNDFGAGGVSVAIGELTDGLIVNLDLVPKKYEGLDGTELAISESQERMAVVVKKEDVDSFIKYAEEENLEAIVVAHVTEERRLKLFWRDKVIVDLSRDFLNTNGVIQDTDVLVQAPSEEKNYFKSAKTVENLKEEWLESLKDLNVCSQKGLSERFDSTIGAGTVLMPFGGKYQVTPAEGMIAKLPVLNGDTTTGTIMTYGYNPKIGKWSPFHGAIYAVVESLAKVVACGGDYSSVRLTFQEYFERLGKEAVRWGKPFSALVGALYAQNAFGTAAIGGKDSMSGTFKDMNVPPTLVSFAVNVIDVNNAISPEFKAANSKVVILKALRDESEVPLFEALKANFEKVTELVKAGKVLSAHTVRHGGIAEAVTKMTFGNRIGVQLENIQNEELFAPDYGSIILEIKGNENLEDLFNGVQYKLLGVTKEDAAITVNNISIEILEAFKTWEKPLEKIFPTKTEEKVEEVENVSFTGRNDKKPVIKIAKPKVFIPVFPGTNCEYDSAKAFINAGAEADVMVLNNLSPEKIKASIDEMQERISKAQMIMLPGGFSAGDEPDGSGKFIATVFRNPKIKDAVIELIKNKDGLMLGICNGFQALIKLGLVPYGEIRDIDENCPTLTYNNIGRHVSCMSYTKVASTLSPWFSNLNAGDVHAIAVSHGEGRFAASEEVIKELIKNGQIATQYVDFNGNATYDIDFNPNGSAYAIEGITSPDGRILGKMGHSERRGSNIHKNIFGNKDQKIFEAGVNYFK